MADYPTLIAGGTSSYSAASVAVPTNLTPGKPAGGTADGDLLVIVTQCRHRLATVTTPTGWKLAPGFPVRSATPSGGSFYVFWKFADSSAADTPTVSWSGMNAGTSGDSSGARMFSWANACMAEGGTLPTKTDTTATTSYTIPAHTTQRANCTVVGIGMKVFSGTEADTGAVSGSGWTESSDGYTTSGIGHHIYTARNPIVSPGSSGAATVTFDTGDTTSSRVLATSFSIQPLRPVVRLARDLGAVAFYQMNDWTGGIPLMHDAIGTMDGGLLGSQTFGVAGTRDGDKAITFDGNDYGVNAPLQTVGPLLWASGQFGIAFWISTTDTAAGTVMGSTNAGSNTASIIQTNTPAQGQTRLYLRDEDATAIYIDIDESQIYDGARHHVMFVNDYVEGLIAFVDGKPVDGTVTGSTWPSNMVSLTNYLTFAANNNNGTNDAFMTGTLDDIIFFGAAFSDWYYAVGETDYSSSWWVARELYLMGVNKSVYDSSLESGSYYDAVMALDPDLFWRLDEADETTKVTDISGNANHGEYWWHHSDDMEFHQEDLTEDGGYSVSIPTQPPDPPGVAGVVALDYKPYQIGTSKTFTAIVKPTTDSGFPTSFAGDGFDHLTGGPFPYTPHPTWEWWFVNGQEFLRHYAEVNTYPVGWSDFDATDRGPLLDRRFHLAVTENDTTGLCQLYIDGVLVSEHDGGFWAACSDSFVGAASTNLSSLTVPGGDPAERTHTWTRATASGAGGNMWTDGNGIAYSNTDATPSVYYSSYVPSSADYSVRADIHYVSGSGWAGVVGRFVAASYNGYGVVYSTAAARWELVRYAGGTPTVLAYWSAPAGDYRVELVMRGTQIDGYIDEIKRLTATDATYSAVGTLGVTTLGNYHFHFLDFFASYHDLPFRYLRNPTPYAVNSALDAGRFTFGYRGPGADFEIWEGGFSDIAVFPSILSAAQIAGLKVASEPTIAPNITSGPTATRISRKAGKDVFTFDWESNVDFQAYQVRVVSSAGATYTQGTQLELNQTPAAWAGRAGTSYTATVTDDEMVAASAAEGSNILKIFVQDHAGNWST